MTDQLPPLSRRDDVTTAPIGVIPLERGEELRLFGVRSRKRLHIAFALCFQTPGGEWVRRGSAIKVPAATLDRLLELLTRGRGLLDRLPAPPDAA
jgi:hypothetical protein